jgi:hypothetical protein
MAPSFSGLIGTTEVLAFCRGFPQPRARCTQFGQPTPFLGKHNSIGKYTRDEPLHLAYIPCMRLRCKEHVTNQFKQAWQNSGEDLLF